MILVADCSALIALASCDALPLLEPLYGDVFVPVAVFDECTVTNKPQSLKLNDYLKDKVKTVRTDLSNAISGSADLGEEQAMLLYLQLGATNLLIDDRRGKKIAQQNNINTVGSLTVLIEAKQAGLISAIKPAIEAIRQSTVFVADAILDAALRVANE